MTEERQEFVSLGTILYEGVTARVGRNRMYGGVGPVAG